MKVIDASALVEILLGSAKGERVGAALRGDQVAAPELLSVEVTSTLARLVRAEELDRSDAAQAVQTFARTKIKFVGHRELVAPAWALRDRIRISDAFYVASARRLRAPLVTCDGRLKRAPLPGITITLVS